MFLPPEQGQRVRRLALRLSAEPVLTYDIAHQKIMEFVQEFIDYYHKKNWPPNPDTPVPGFGAPGSPKKG